MGTEVKLSQSYTVADKVFTEITLRRPTYKEVYMDGIGKPEEWQMSPNGPVLVTYPAVVDAYAKVLIVNPGYEYIAGLDSVDAVRLERAICDFFRDGTASTSP